MLIFVTVVLDWMLLVDFMTEFLILLSLQKGWSLIQEREREREREKERERETCSYAMGGRCC